MRTTTARCVCDQPIWFRRRFGKDKIVFEFYCIRVPESVRHEASAWLESNAPGRFEWAGMSSLDWKPPFLRILGVEIADEFGRRFTAETEALSRLPLDEHGWRQAPPKL